MRLKNTVNEYVEGIEKMTEQFKKQFGAMLLEEDALNGEQFELFQGMFGLMEVSTKLVRDQAEAICEINEKLDQVLFNQKIES